MIIDDSYIEAKILQKEKEFDNITRIRKKISDYEGFIS